MVSWLLNVVLKGKELAVFRLLFVVKLLTNYEIVTLFCIERYLTVFAGKRVFFEERMV
jgi:hypothetical protein